MNATTLERPEVKNVLVIAANGELRQATAPRGLDSVLGTRTIATGGSPTVFEGIATVPRRRLG